MMKPPELVCCFLLCCLLAGVQKAGAQQNDCLLKDPVVRIDFGRGSNVQEFNAVALPHYERILGSCPTDGHYTYTSYTANCFQGDWFTLAEDHTPGDREGNMMLVNASPAGGVFFHRTVTGLKENTTYEFALWMINVCRLHICCSSLSPNISIQLSAPSGKRLASFRIGELPQRTDPLWRKFAGFFTLPAGERSVVLVMQNSTIGGCGNDFALDDITLRECVRTQAAVAATPKKTPPPAARQQPPVAKPVVKKVPDKKTPETAAPKTAAVLPRRKDSAVGTLPVLKQKPAVTTPAPLVLRTRANPLIKQIKTTSGDITIDLYDNGEIDGDTVSVYHNNELIVPATRLSQKPIRFRVQVNAATPYHELIMVAHNLGSIPPNTSLMIVTAGEERHQVFISSSEQKNAKVVIELKE